ncbi:hypothetical protein [Microbacterium sp. W4I20]|uniref:hypothetical protein n=1 Tax=Microbacterium sp. W4I20 TaxID=3042262 RepID=UPI0027D8518B|nr:hypothetical protein [Microbacterium sp. W4I20]
MDYVTCVPDADDWNAYFHAAEDEDDALELQPTEDLVASAEGVVVHFAAPDQDWDSLTVGASYFSSVRVRSDSFTPDGWHWNTDEWFHTRGRCLIEE